MRTKQIFFGLIALLLFVGIQPGGLSAAELLMFREKGCPWCEKWDREIGEIYPKTSEGKRAPIREMDIGDPIPDFITKRGLVHFTPTFVLVEKDREIGRITGYPGEVNFWGLLEELVLKLQ